ncbi:Nucleolar protein 9, partial [Massospora cicadina]
MQNGHQVDLECLMASAFNEMRGNEFQLVVDHECSRVLEKLLCLAPDYMKVYMLNVLSERFLTLVTHRFASHVCQTLLVLSAKMVEKEVKGIPMAIPDDQREGLEALPSIVELIQKIAGALRGRWSEFSFNPFASHPLRVLALELTGSHLVPASFQALLAGVSKEMIFELSDVVVRSSVLHSNASPLLQLMLLVSHTPPRGAIRKEILINGDKLRNAFVLTMLKDSVGSHLFEIILKVVSPAMYNRIYLLYFRGRVMELSLHMISNYAVQALISNVRSAAQLGLILEEIRPDLQKLLRINRIGILRSVVDGCLGTHSCYKEAIKAIMQAYQADTPTHHADFALLVLMSCDYNTFLERVPDPKPKYLEQGSLLLQALLRFPEPHNAILVSSLLSQPSGVLLGLAKDPVASHVLDKFLISPTVSLKAKRKLTRAFEGSLHLLATDKGGSRVLDKLWAVADISTKEAMVSELIPHEHSLANNFFGKFVLRNFRVEHYKRKREEWKLGEVGGEKRKDLFRDLLGDEKIASIQKPAPPKSFNHPTASETLGAFEPAVHSNNNPLPTTKELQGDAQEVAPPVPSKVDAKQKPSKRKLRDSDDIDSIFEALAAGSSETGKGGAPKPKKARKPKKGDAEIVKLIAASQPKVKSKIRTPLNVIAEERITRVKR